MVSWSLCISLLQIGGENNALFSSYHSPNLIGAGLKSGAAGGDSEAIAPTAAQPFFIFFPRSQRFCQQILWRAKNTSSENAESIEANAQTTDATMDCSMAEAVPWWNYKIDKRVSQKDTYNEKEKPKIEGKFSGITGLWGTHSQACYLKR